MTRHDTIGRRISARLGGHHHDVLDTWTRNGVGPGEWVTAAACRGHDPELFFTPDSMGIGRWSRQLQADTIKAKRICAGCPVRAECLTHALNAHETGIWGGLSDSERDDIRRSKRG